MRLAVGALSVAKLSLERMYTLICTIKNFVVYVDAF